MKIKYRKKQIGILAVVASVALCGHVQSADYKLSNESGSFVQRMTKAVNKASWGDKIIVDGNYTTGGYYTLTKAGLNITGYGKTVTSTGGGALRIRANNTKVQGLTFVNGTRSVVVDGGGTRSNLVFHKITIRGTGYAGLFMEDTNINNLKVNYSTFTKTFAVLMEDCDRFTNVNINNNTFNNTGGNDHQISLDCAESGSTNHSNINIYNNTFNKCGAFNIALANMKAGFIRNNTMYGGTRPYSQCIHIEDRTENTYIKSNQMRNTGSGTSPAVLLFATDRSGRARGDVLTAAQKLNEYSPKNISLESNTVHAAGSNAVLVQLLRPGSKIKFRGPNKLNANNQAIFKWNQVAANQFVIADATELKGRKWSQLKNWSANARSSYINF